MRKKDNVFRDDLALRLQKLRETYFSSMRKPTSPVPKTLNLKPLKKNLRRKLSIGLLSKDVIKKGTRRPLSKHIYMNIG